MRKYNKLSFNDDHEFFETLGFLSRDDTIFDLRQERNEEAGAWGSQIRFYWKTQADISSLPRPLREAFSIPSHDSQRRISETKFVRELADNHSFSNFDETSYITHWTKTSLDDVLATVPEEYVNDFWRGYHWNYEIEKKLQAGVNPNWDETTHQVAEVEGAAKGYYVTKYERKKANRDAAIRIHGCFCNICGFDFEKTYGEIGKAFIEVHHIRPLASLDEEVVIDPQTDLICVCSNCHRMLHRFTDYMVAVDELKRRINN